VRSENYNEGKGVLRRAFGLLLGRKIEGIRSKTTVSARPMYVLEVTWGNVMDSRVELCDEVGSCGVFIWPFQSTFSTNQQFMQHVT
jgi:hypothetical protein